MTTGDKEITIKMAYDDSRYLRISIEEFADMLKRSEGIETAKPYSELDVFVNQQVRNQLG